MARLGLQGKLVVYTVGLIFVVTFLLSWRIIHIDVKAIRTSFERKAESLSESMAVAVREDLYALRVHRLRNTIERLRLVDEEIDSAQVLDEDGNLLTDGSVHNKVRGNIPDDAFTRELLRRGRNEAQAIDGILYTGSAILSPPEDRFWSGEIIVTSK